jgi:hypothetical protein
MNVGTRRTVFAAAALAAAGLYGSLPYHESAQGQGVPTVHRDVALVDIVSDETAFDDLLYTDLTSLESGLYGAVDTAYGGGATGATDAAELLGASTALPYDGLFDNGANYAGSGLFLDAWATEDELNQALGISAATSQAEILADIGKDPVYLSGDTLPTAGSADFDSDLTTIANADFGTASTDFTNYVDSLSNLGSLDTGTGLTAVLTELDTAYTADIGGLTTDLNTVYTDILGDLGSSTATSGLDGILASLLTDLGASLF